MSGNRRISILMGYKQNTSYDALLDVAFRSCEGLVLQRIEAKMEISSERMTRHIVLHFGKGSSSHVHTAAFPIPIV